MVKRPLHKALLMSVIIAVGLFSRGFCFGQAERVDRNEIISAQVMLLPASGEKIGPDTQITAENIEKFAPPSDAYLIASGAFRSIDFEIGPLVGVTFSITAPARIFEGLEVQRYEKLLLMVTQVGYF